MSKADNMKNMKTEDVSSFSTLIGVEVSPSPKSPVKGPKKRSNIVSDGAREGHQQCKFINQQKIRKLL